MEWHLPRAEEGRAEKIVITKLGRWLPISEAVRTGPFVHPHAASSASETAGPGLVTLEATYNRWQCGHMK
jgi:hypothetical protein